MRNLLSAIKDAGVIGAGGAGFPTHIKFSGKYETIIVNGAECEPLLEKDQHIMKTYPEFLVRTLKYILEKSGAIRGIFAVKAKYRECVEALKPFASDGVSLYLLGDYYPAGDEQEIVYSVSGKVVPPGGIPLDVGVVVTNVETLYNIGRALEGNPVLEKYLTVTGAVKNPCTIKVPVGTPFSEILKVVGGATSTNFSVIEGGVMTGKLIKDLNSPVKKTTSAFILLPYGHPALQRRLQDINRLVRIASSACTQCRFCTDLCPRYLLGHPLEPHKIMRTTYHTAWGTIETLKSAFLCCDCGICELYACPMGISPRTIIQRMKASLVERGIRFDGKRMVEPRSEKDFRRVPKSILINRLQLFEYESAGAPFADLKIVPSEVIIPLDQHIGKPATPIVNAGDKVRARQLVAIAPDEGIGASYHSPVDGVVVRVDGEIVIRREV